MTDAHPGETGDPAGHADPAPHAARFRTTLIRVLLVQVATLALLWLLQATYHS